MTKEQFSKRFKKAYEDCLKLASNIISDNISDKYLFNLYMNLYKDHKHVEKYLRLTFDEAVNSLYRKNGIPKWIDINVAKIKDDNTILKCDYSSDFISDDSKLQFSDAELSPFKVKPPSFSNLKKLEKIKKGEKVSLDYFDEERG